MYINLDVTGITLSLKSLANYITVLFSKLQAKNTFKFTFFNIQLKSFILFNLTLLTILSLLF